MMRRVPTELGCEQSKRRRRCLSYEEPDLDVHPYHAALGVKAVACFPLIVAEQAVGLLYIYLHEERQFTHLEQLMLDNFVNQAAMAIYHARRLAGIRRDLVRKERGAESAPPGRIIDLLPVCALKRRSIRFCSWRSKSRMLNTASFVLLDKNGEFLVTQCRHGDAPGAPTG